jgi:hypothetical protein
VKGSSWLRTFSSKARLLFPPSSRSGSGILLASSPAGSLRVNADAVAPSPQSEKEREEMG